MRQSKLESIIESVLNIGSGMIIAFCVTQFILVPAFDIPISVGDNTIITLVLTVVSVTRSYCWRRFFNAGIHKQVHKWAKSLTEVRDE